MLRFERGKLLLEVWSEGNRHEIGYSLGKFIKAWEWIYRNEENALKLVASVSSEWESLGAQQNLKLVAETRPYS